MNTNTQQPSMFDPEELLYANGDIDLDQFNKLIEQSQHIEE